MDEDEMNNAKIETKKGSTKYCFSVRNILTKEKLKDKYEDKSMSKHTMRKCKVVKYVDKEI